MKYDTGILQALIKHNTLHINTCLKRGYAD